MSMYYGMDGQPISMDKYCEMFADTAGRIIGRTDLPGGIMVSTVWLGLDHGFGQGPPLIFESMVFPPGNSVELDFRRYATREEAELGHAELVTKWTGWTPGEDMPEERQLSVITQFLDALSLAAGERPYTEEESLQSDQMVVMYPKEDGVADRLAPNDEEPLEGE